MPPPEIEPGDTQKSWVSKCVPYVMKESGKSKDQALGQCFGMWKEHLKKKKSKANILDKVAGEIKNCEVDKKE